MMLYVYRKIRKKLLTEQKFRTYFNYAIGEILLVVIGILIAVGINNWNQNGKERQAEKQYLKNLLSDLQLQMNETQRCINSESANAQYIREIGSQIEKGFEETDVERLSIIMTKSMINRSLNIYDATFEELKATGSIELISNDSLKTAIIEYYQALDRSSLVLQKLEHQLYNTLMSQLLAADLLNFDIRFDQINENLGSNFLIRSGESIGNPVVDSLAVYDFNKLTMENLKSEKGAFRLKNIISSRYFAILVSLVNFNQAKINTERLKAMIELELNQK